jgi:uncharacterized membrane protein
MASQEVTVGTRWLVWVRLLLVGAIAGASYLAWVAIHHGAVAGCEPGSGCDKVLQSRWAYWLNIPVSIPAVLVYLALLIGTFILENRTSPDEQRGAWAAIIGLSVIVAGAALWFVGLQMFVIEAFCKFCLVAHACGFAAAVMCLRHIPLATNSDASMWASGAKTADVPRAAMSSLVLIGVAGVLVLVSGQVFVQKQRNLVKSFANPATGNATGPTSPKPGTPNSANAVQSEVLLSSPNVTRIAPYVLSLYGGKFLLHIDELPMIGSPKASNIIVNLYDYNCTHCRMLHPMLVEAQRRLGNQLGIVTLPMPMSTNCNPFVPPEHPTFSNSCDYARISLAVWHASPFIYPQFQNWLFSAPQPIPFEVVQDQAEQMVGKDSLRAASTNDWIDKQILTACSLHSTNWQTTGGMAMPQIVMGQAISVGPLNSVNHLMVLLEKYLDVKITP